MFCGTNYTCYRSFLPKPPHIPFNVGNFSSQEPFKKPEFRDDNFVTHKNKLIKHINKRFSFSWQKLMSCTQVVKNTYFEVSRGANQEIAALFNSWAFQAYLGTDNGANKYQNRS